MQLLSQNDKLVITVSTSTLAAVLWLESLFNVELRVAANARMEMITEIIVLITVLVITVGNINSSLMQLLDFRRYCDATLLRFAQNPGLQTPDRHLSEEDAFYQ